MDLRPRWPRADCAWLAALRTERVLVLGERVGVVVERVRVVNFVTARGLEERRERVRAFCVVRDVWCAKRLSVLGRGGEELRRRWER